MKHEFLADITLTRGNTAAGYRPHLVATASSRLPENYMGVRFLDPMVQGDNTGVRFETVYDKVDYTDLAPTTFFEVREGGNPVGFGVVRWQVK